MRSERKNIPVTIWPSLIPNCATNQIIAACLFWPPSHSHKLGPMVALRPWRFSISPARGQCVLKYQHCSYILTILVHPTYLTLPYPTYRAILPSRPHKSRAEHDSLYGHKWTCQGFRLKDIFQISAIIDSSKPNMSEQLEFFLLTFGIYMRNVSLYSLYWSF
jgi:hypothetical protein